MLHLFDILLLCLFLFPVAVYFTVLGLINRRPQPLMISGSWDFVGVILATSGFLLFAGPALLSGIFQRNLREVPVRYDTEALGDALGELWAGWWMMWLLYYLLIISGAVILVWVRRGATVIYNIDPRTLDTVLARIAQRLGLAIERRGNHLEFVAAPVESSQWSENSAEPAAVVQRPPSTVHGVAIDLEPFPMLSNIGLHWRHATPEARADVERELRKGLGEVFTLENAAGGWLLGIAGFLLLLIVLLVAVFVVLVVMVSRRGL